MTDDVDDLAQLERDLQISLWRDSFLSFVVDHWSLVEPGRRFVLTIASEALIIHLQAVADRKIDRIAISLAPSSGKSTILVLFGAWLWLKRPGARSIHASHALDLARRDSQRTRRLIESDRYRAIVAGQWTLRPDANRLDLFESTAGGHRIAIGVGGALTGLRAGAGGIIAVDDSLNAVDARSKLTRDAVNDWFDLAVTTRLDPGDGGIVVVQQRLHSSDLIQHVIDLGYESLVLPSLFDAKRRCVTSVWQDPRTVDGELLAPEIHSAAYLAEQKRVLGTAGFSCQYLANPTDDEGGLFPRHHWRWWKPDGTASDVTRRPRGCSDAPAVALPAEGRVVVSLDAAFKDLSTSDAVCFLVALVVGAERYILARRYGKMSFSLTVDTLRELADTYPGATFLVEDKANGSAILDQCRKVVPNLIAITPKESKEARAASCSPAVEGGQVFLPEGADWPGDLVEECAAFPRGQHDDQVDSLSQLLNWASKRSTTPNPHGGFLGNASSAAPTEPTGAPASIYSLLGGGGSAHVDAPPAVWSIGDNLW